MFLWCWFHHSQVRENVQYTLSCCVQLVLLNMMICSSIVAAAKDRTSFWEYLNSIPLCIQPLFLFIHPLTSFWAGFIVKQLWIVYQNMWMWKYLFYFCKYIFNIMILSLWCICLVEEFLDCVVVLFLFCRFAILFPIMVVGSDIPTAQCRWAFCLLMTTILTGLCWCCLWFSFAFLWSLARLKI